MKVQASKESLQILLIARHFPPEVSGGARRPFLYAGALRKQGHRVMVVTPFSGAHVDCLQVSNSAIERGTNALHSTEHLGEVTNRLVSVLSLIKNAIRTWVYWPDNNITWVRSVIREVKDSDFKPSIIFTTSPPESIHIAGKKLASHFHIPWVAELRDTWVETPHRKVLSNSKLRAFIEKKIARRVLGAAQGITAVSEAVMSEGRKYLKSGTPERIIPHFSDKPIESHTFDPSKLNLVHTGGFTLSDRRRLLPPLLEALNVLSEHRPELVFHIAGPLSREEQSSISETNVTVEWHGTVSLYQSTALQSGADGLILYSPKNSHALPGKYAEYVQARRPILYFGEGDWLSLVQNPQDLKPLLQGGLHLKSGMRVSGDLGLTSDDAASSLVEFFGTVVSSV